MAPKRVPLETRFLDRIAGFAGDGCWLWTGATNGKYGTISLGGRGGRTMYAHRVSWQIANGKTPPPGLDIAHTCDTPLCVNPAHLFAASRKENMRDMIQKGRNGPLCRPGEDHQWAKLAAHQVAEIRRRYVRRPRGASGGRRGCLPGSLLDLARQFGVTPVTVRNIVDGVNWTHI